MNADSSVDPLEVAKCSVAALDAESLGRFASWFTEYHAAAWDMQMAQDFSDPATLARFIDEKTLKALIESSGAE